MAAEKPDHAGVVVPPPLFWAAAMGLGLALQKYSALPAVPRPVAVPAGWALVLFWILGTAAAMREFRRARTSLVPVKPAAALLTAGPFRLSRNPLYLSLTALYAAVSLLVGALWPLLLLPLVLWLVQRLVIAREEAYLERRFGEQYRRYRGRVRRWL
jgi:protein-S-isoprenylcysteine O-methyltransferase Ste14